MDKGVVVDIGNDIEGFVPLSQITSASRSIARPTSVYEGMNLDMRVLEVDPIHRRIVLRWSTSRRISRRGPRRRRRFIRKTATPYLPTCMRCSSPRQNRSTNPDGSSRGPAGCGLLRGGRCRRTVEEVTYEAEQRFRLERLLQQR